MSGELIPPYATRAGDGGAWCRRCATWAEDIDTIRDHYIAEHLADAISAADRLVQTQQALAASQADLTAADARIAELTVARDWEREVVGMLRRNEHIRAQVIRDRNAERDRLKAQLARVERERDGVREALARMAAELDDVRHDLAHKNFEIAKLRTQLDHARAELVSARQELALRRQATDERSTT